METVKEQLQSVIADNNIVLFMKGDPHQPQCGFSARVVDILKEYQIEFIFLNLS